MQKTQIIFLTDHFDEHEEVKLSVDVSVVHA
jgi:hypothetical protein